MPRACALAQRGAGFAPSASFSRVHTFMFTTTPMISRIFAASKCFASPSWKRWNVRSASVSAARVSASASRRAARSPRSAGRSSTTPSCVDLRARDPSVAGGLVVKVEAVAAVVELRAPLSQELREASVDAQLRLVPECVGTHPRHADQRVVLRRIGSVVGYLDLVAHFVFPSIVIAFPDPFPRRPPTARRGVWSGAWELSHPCGDLLRFAPRARRGLTQIESGDVT